MHNIIKKLFFCLTVTSVSIVLNPCKGYAYSYEYVESIPTPVENFNEELSIIDYYNIFTDENWDCLSNEEKRSNMLLLENYVANRLELTTIPDIVCADLGKENHKGEYCFGKNLIAINEVFLSSNDSNEASKATKSNGEILFSTILHEMRHYYQDMHQHDDTDYGRCVESNMASYVYAWENTAGYYEQFLEMDARRFTSDTMRVIEKNFIYSVN